MLKFNFYFDVPHKDTLQAHGQLEFGTKLAILGPSGCGKSTFLKALAGLSHKRSGESTWLDQKFSQELLNEGVLGFCFQSSPLFSHLTVLENLALPLETLKKYRPLSSELKNQRAQELLLRAGLIDLTNRFPHDLSGGEKKRVSLLRSLIFKAPLLILDEPFSDLDEENRRLFKKWLCEILLDHKGVLIFVTHHESDIQDLANLRFDWPSNKETVLDFSKAQKL